MDEQDSNEALRRGRELYDKRDYPNAEVLLNEVLAAGRAYADVYDMLGVIAHARRDLAAAEKRFRKAVEINPRYTEALLNLAITLNDQHKFDEAREVFAQLHAQTPRSAHEIEPFARGKLANLHADLAQAYADLGLLPEAIQQLEQGVRLCPTFADLRTRLASLHRDSGQHSLAREHLLAAIEQSPRTMRARILLGSTLLSLGDREGAREAWRQALAIEPENARAASFLRMLDDG